MHEHEQNTQSREKFLCALLGDMPRAYSEDIRWRAIWLTEIIGLDVEEVSFYLQLHVKKNYFSVHR